MEVSSCDIADVSDVDFPRQLLGLSEDPPFSPPSRNLYVRIIAEAIDFPSFKALA